MKARSQKNRYLPPKVVSVSFVVERGFDMSSLVMPVLPIIGAEAYGDANNSGADFWQGGASSTGGAMESYGSYEWNW